jgi:NADH:ubiquinone oxidoreductase subunit E
MSKKILICCGKACKSAGTHKKLKKWSSEISAANKVKKTKCLGICKESFAIKFNGEIYSCDSKKELEKIIEK